MRSLLAPIGDAWRLSYLGKVGGRCDSRPNLDRTPEQQAWRSDAIFTVETPLGHRVFLTRDRWRQIVRHKHPALAGKEKEVRACLESPSVIRASTKEAETHMYYRPVDEVLLCVVVAPAEESEHFVVTAYFRKNIKKGTELWTS